jgi:hypothetical protein
MDIYEYDTCTTIEMKMALEMVPAGLTPVTLTP